MLRRPGLSGKPASPKITTLVDRGCRRTDRACHRGRCVRRDGDRRHDALDRSDLIAGKVGST